MEKDVIIVLFDYLILFTYLIFIIFICLHFIRFLKRKNVDYLIRLLSVASITLLSSLAIINFGYEKSDEAPFFKILITTSLILMLILGIILIAKNIWHEKYEQVVSKFQFMQKRFDKASHTNK